MSRVMSRTIMTVSRGLILLMFTNVPLIKVSKEAYRVASNHYQATVFQRTCPCSTHNGVASQLSSVVAVVSG